MAFVIPRSILALAVRPVDWLTLDVGSRRGRTPEVLVNIIDEYH